MLAAVKKSAAQLDREIHAALHAPAHARARTTRDEYIVQGNYGYGDGWEDLTAEETRKEALQRLREYRENEGGTPFRLIKRRQKIAGTSAPAHASKKKLEPAEAKLLLQAGGIDFSRDFHALSSNEVDLILATAKSAGYRKRKDAPGSTARMFYQYLARLR